jgi:hypothetical protein
MTSAFDCSGQPDGTSCSDGIFCNGEETCQGGVCAGGTPPCQICDEALQECIDFFDCPSVPQMCRASQKGLLLIKNQPDDNRDKLLWKFIKGAQTTQAELADLRSTADCALCVYAGTTDTLVATINVPPNNTKWTTIGSRGLCVPRSDAGQRWGAENPREGWWEREEQDAAGGEGSEPA